MQPDNCYLCKLYCTDARYRHLWDGLPPPEITPVSAETPRKTFTPAPCKHLGAATGETRDCPTCTGRVTLKLLSCDLHGTCHPTKLVSGVVCCRICKDYQPYDNPPAAPAQGAEDSRPGSTWPGRESY